MSKAIENLQAAQKRASEPRLPSLSSGNVREAAE